MRDGTGLIEVCVTECLAGDPHGLVQIHTIGERIIQYSISIQIVKT